MVVMFPIDRESDPANYLADLADAPIALVGHRCVDRDAVDPRLRWSYRLPGRPPLEGTLKCVLGAVFRGRTVAEHDGERSEDLSVRGLIQALEIRPVGGVIDDLHR